MTYFPLQFSRLAQTSIRRSVALVRSGPPLETAIAPLRERRKDQQRRRQSSLSVMNAGDQACPETRPCPHPSSGCRKLTRTLAGKADGTDVFFANVESQHRHAAQLNTHAHPFVERLIGTLRREYLDHLLCSFDGSPTADPCIRPQWLPDSLEDSGSLRHPVITIDATSNSWLVPSCMLAILFLRIVSCILETVGRAHRRAHRLDP
jgi:hypothetical protein